jgi:hypothetical protein
MMTALSKWAGQHNRYVGQIAMAKQILGSYPPSITTEAASKAAFIWGQLYELEQLLKKRVDPEYLKKEQK